MEMIQEWLNGNRNYLVGRAIFKTFSEDLQLQEYFENNTGNQALEKLIVAMTGLLSPPAAQNLNENRDPAPIKAPSEQIHHLPTEAENEAKNAHSARAEMPESADIVLKALRIQWITPYKQMMHLISRLDTYGERNDPEAIQARSGLACRILELEQECMRLWAKRDHFLKHGQLPDQGDELEIPSDPIELAKMILRIKNNIRQSKKRMLANPANPTYAANYLKYKEDYKKLTGEPYPEKL